MVDTTRAVEASRRIEAPPVRIFEVVASPSRHTDFDGSGMLRGAVADRPIVAVGDTFTMRMHRLGRDYLMINHVVAFEPERLVAWEPAPGDVDTAGGDASRIGIPSGYRWGYRLVPDGDGATVVTAFFDCGSEENSWILEDGGGGWINGRNPVLESMGRSLALLDGVCTA